MPETSTRAGLLAALEQERSALLAVLPRFDDTQWRAVIRDDGWTAHDITAHLADSTYGLALLTLGEVQPSVPIDEKTGWLNPHELNAQRRERNAGLPREKVMSRLASSFDHARRAVETIDDYGAPGPYGESHTKGQWLQRIVDHAHSHRAELEEMLGKQG
jgi:hypothetical protein